jgi:protein DGCR14
MERRRLATLAVALLCVLAAAAAPVLADAASARAALAEAGIEASPVMLLAAAAAGETAKVKLLVEAGVDATAATPFGSTALWLAVEYKHLDVLEVLLAAGVEPKGATAPVLPGGRSIALDAVDTGDVAYVRALVEAGAEPDLANDYGMTPLAVAAQAGHLEICRVLLEKGANPNAAPGGFPLLFGPVNEDHVDVVKRLLGAGAKLGEHRERILGAAKSPQMTAVLEAAE